MLGGHGGRHLRWPTTATRSVQARPRRRSIGSQHALGRAPTSPADIGAVVVGLVDRVTAHAGRGRVGRTVTLRLRFDDFSRATRSHTVPEATAHTSAILEVVRSLVAGAMPVIQREGVTLVGVAVGNLGDDDAVQLALPFERRSRSALDAALDQVRAPVRDGSGHSGGPGRPGPGHGCPPPARLNPRQ